MRPPCEGCLRSTHFVDCLQRMPDHFDVLWTRIPMYSAVTRNIAVTVSPRFMPERSSNQEGRYFWAYTIEISNSGDTTLPLKTRDWAITDAVGQRREVREAVIGGEEAVLHPSPSSESQRGRAFT